MSNYKSRNYPCTCVPDEELWCLTAWLRDGSGGGVVDWCTDELDAHRRLAMIQRDPRYRDAQVEPYGHAAERVLRYVDQQDVRDC